MNENGGSSAKNEAANGACPQGLFHILRYETYRVIGLSARIGDFGN